MPVSAPATVMPWPDSQPAGNARLVASAAADLLAVAVLVVVAGVVATSRWRNVTSRPSLVVVTGLVSVASIAGYKRHLGRLQGVTTVGVSSGPDGEFVFSVHHLPTVDLAAGITGLPGFESKVTSQSEGAIEVAARDPEAHD